MALDADRSVTTATDDRLREALDDLLAAIGVAKRITETIMPESMPCGHDRGWLLSLFADIIEAKEAVRAALSAEP